MRGESVHRVKGYPKHLGSGFRLEDLIVDVHLRGGAELFCARGEEGDRAFPSGDLEVQALEIVGQEREVVIESGSDFEDFGTGGKGCEVICIRDQVDRVRGG